jgi:hypothetical protein
MKIKADIKITVNGEVEVTKMKKIIFENDNSAGNNKEIKEKTEIKDLVIKVEVNEDLDVTWKDYFSGVADVVKGAFRSLARVEHIVHDDNCPDSK